MASDFGGSIEWCEFKRPSDGDGEGSHSIKCFETWVDLAVNFVTERGYLPLPQLTARVVGAVDDNGQVALAADGGNGDGGGQQASGRDARGVLRRHIGSVYGGATSGAVIDLTYRLYPQLVSSWDEVGVSEWNQMFWF